ncbi:MAG: alpha-1,4-glucan--maltose-1-phosphate maltosyltransferase [Deltaproteobacteria bacterium]|nr:alpha-1,4-glucan--maltose-1-phosphate maltosyltransferase [Deltaproteobacteria bacterium]
MKTSAMTDGQIRAAITNVQPEIEHGRFPIKRTVGEKVVVEADIFTDGHDALAAVLLYRHEKEQQWREVPLLPLANDHWRGEFVVGELGRYVYTVHAWVDRFTSWRHALTKKVEAGQDIIVDLLIGAQLFDEASVRAAGREAGKLKEWAGVLRLARESPLSQRTQLALAEELAPLVAQYPDRRGALTYDKELVVVVEREHARFSTWYEMFPRSCSLEPGRHGAFKDCEARLPYVAAMGFDVLYFPPIHPIGRTYRKGKNNTFSAGPHDPGSPWAIGAEEGGHQAIHPQLGTLADFRRLVDKAREQGIEIALDLALQCTPDHPYVEEHLEWFRHRPDGSIQYAENPPKKYQDIYPFDFDTDHWQTLWEELKSIVLFWIAQDIRVFRVDNPHTKPFRFWEWLISVVKKEHPEVIFLSEAFTRPKVMYRLAQLGFSQSYTYFAWRTTKPEIMQYFTELTQTEVREYFRPNLWPNTPDILTEYLQLGGRAAFIVRLVLAATLGANYGIYGPAFELCENCPREAGSEEYLDSEKYEIRWWDLSKPESLRDVIARVNRIRRENPALQRDWSLRFHRIENDQLLCYSKSTEDYANVILVVVNLDPHHTHSDWMELSLETLGLDPQQPYQAHDLLSDARYLWSGARNYIELNPQVMPAHVFRIRRRVRTERDFDYYM